MPTQTNNKKSEVPVALIIAGAIVIIVAVFMANNKTQERRDIQTTASPSPTEREECEEWEIYYIDPAGRSIPVKRNLPNRKIADEARDAWDLLYRGVRQHHVRCVKWRGQ